MKNNILKIISRISAFVLILTIIFNMAGCSIRKKNIVTEKVLVDKTEDETIWVEEDSVTSEYSDARVEYTSAEQDSSESEKTGTEEEEEVEKELTQEEVEAPFKLKQSMYIRDVSVHKPLYYYENFAIDSGLFTYGFTTYDKDLALASLKHHNLPTSADVSFPIAHKNVAEWGYTFFLTTADGMGNLIGQGGFNPVPKTRQAAIAQLKKWMISAYKLQNVLDVGFEALNGHYPWQHYAAEFGANAVGLETGETISLQQAKIAFTRGAAKQNGIPWYCDFSYWYQNLMRAYTEELATNYSPVYGHSHNLHERIFVTAYMGGMSHFICEDAIAQSLWQTKKTKDGYYEITGGGEVIKKYYDFTKRESDVGIQYIPFGILMDREHGGYSGSTAISEYKAFQVFDYTKADYMNRDIMQLFFPGTNEVTDFYLYETNILVNSPYGNSCEVILQNASQKVLNSYPVLIMTGDLSDASPTEKSRYQKYVKQGGILVMNTAYLELFPDYQAKYDNSGKMEITDEKGKVIIYGDDYDISKLDGILAELSKALMPFEISGDADYIVNIKNGSLIVTLINNKGVYKPADREGWVDESATVDVTVKYKGNLAIKSVKEIYEQQKVELSGKSVTTTLDPGEINIIEFNFG